MSLLRPLPNTSATLVAVSMFRAQPAQLCLQGERGESWLRMATSLSRWTFLHLLHLTMNVAGMGVGRGLRGGFGRAYRALIRGISGDYLEAHSTS